MKILLVEDDDQIASFVVKGLKQAGYTVNRANNGEDGLQLDGLSLINRLRQKKILTPVIVLSAKNSVDDREQNIISRTVKTFGPKC